MGGKKWTFVVLPLALWVCALPLVLVLAVPRLGTWTALLVASALLAGIFVVCGTALRATGRVR